MIADIVNAVGLVAGVLAIMYGCLRISMANVQSRPPSLPPGPERRRGPYHAKYLPPDMSAADWIAQGRDPFGKRIRGRQ